MTDKDLKPCPCCGEMPHLDRHDIFCDCGLKVNIPAYDNREDNNFPTYEEAVQEMIDIWNTRVEDALIQSQKAEIERLQKENSFLRKRLDTITQQKIEVSVEELIVAKSEAYKEFRGLALRRIGYFEHTNAVVRGHINQTYKELTEVKNNG